MEFQFLFAPLRMFLLGLIFCGSATSSLAQAETGRLLSLQEAISQTLSNNPQLYQFSLREVVLSAKRTMSENPPAIDLELNVENFAGSGAYRDFESSELTLSLASVIELGAKRSKRVSAMNAHLGIAALEREAATLDLLGELTSSYIRTLATQYNMKLADQSLILSRGSLETVQLRAERGAAPEADVLRARATVARARIRVSALERQFERQKHKLALFWGSAQPNFMAVDGNLFEFGASDSFSELYEKALESPAIRVFASKARLKEADVKLAQAGQRADISWRFGVKRFEDTHDSAIVAGVSIPLFSENRNSGNVKAALAELDGADYDRQEALLSLRTRLFDAFSIREQSIDAVMQMSQTAIPALETALTLTHEAFESGRYRYQDWLAAQTELLEAKQIQIDAATNALLSQSLIEQLTGEALAR